MKLKKNLLTLITAAVAFSAQASEIPLLEVNVAAQYILDIPYFEYESPEEGRIAYEVKLFAPVNPSPVFSVDFLSLKRKPVGNLPTIKGDNACLKTAHGAFLACKAEAKMDFTIDTARCLNSNDPECTDDIQSSFADETEACKATDEARIQLCGILGGDAYRQLLDPNDFIDPTTITPANANPYFPLVKGNTWIYEAGDETITVTVSDQTVEILGITAVVVHDVVTEEGELKEDTDDWYAQDKQGNIWYMGEISRNYEDGWLDDIEGSWRSGDESAQPGILIYAQPENHIGETFRQEFLAGIAEDFARVTSVNASTANENFSCESNCLQTYENSPFEPVGFNGNTPEAKFYLPGVGKIRSYHFDPETGAVAEGEEVDELISFTPGS